MRHDYIRLADNKVTIFQRKLKSGDIYYARYAIDKNARNLADGQRYITESLKTNDESTARVIAQERYLDIRFKSKTSQAIKGKFVRDGINDFLKWYESRIVENSARSFGRGNFTKSMLRIYRKTIERYWLEYCGDLELALVNSETFEKYEIWRRSYYSRQKELGNKIHGNGKDNIADKTLALEYNCFKRCLRWCLENKYYLGNEIQFTYYAKKNRRRAFSLQQYMRLVRYMRTNDYLNKGKHKNDYLIRRSREQFRAYVLFITNIGLRVGEARQLKWRDVDFSELIKDGVTKKYIRVSVSSNTKTGSREAIGRYTAYRALERLRENRKDNVGDDDLVFCKQDGSAVQHMNDIFNAVIREADVEFDTDGNKFAVYCLRHTFITFRLRFMKNVDVNALAKSCGTGMLMIENYYDDTTTEDYVEKLI